MNSPQPIVCLLSLLFGAVSWCSAHHLFLLLHVQIYNDSFVDLTDLCGRLLVERAMISAKTLLPAPGTGATRSLVLRAAHIKEGSIWRAQELCKRGKWQIPQGNKVGRERCAGRSVGNVRRKRRSRERGERLASTILDNPMTMTMTHSEKSHIHRMKAWPYPTKKESVLLVELARRQGAQVQTVERQNVVQRYLK